MRYLLYFDVALAAFGAVMTIAVGFVALVYALYLHSSPRLGAGLPGILTITACFVVLMLIAGGATWGLWHRRPWHWWVQAALAVTLPLLYLTIYANLRSP